MYKCYLPAGRPDGKIFCGGLIIKNFVARDLPGGKRSLVINMMAQHITFDKAIKPIKI